MYSTGLIPDGWRGRRQSDGPSTVCVPPLEQFRRASNVVDESAPRRLIGRVIGILVGICFALRYFLEVGNNDWPRILHSESLVHRRHTLSIG